MGISTFMREENGKGPIMITWTKRLLLTYTILGLLATNVLTLTSIAKLHS
jgi:hypothetical protein